MYSELCLIPAIPPVQALFFRLRGDAQTSCYYWVVFHQTAHGLCGFDVMVICTFQFPYISCIPLVPVDSRDLTAPVPELEESVKRTEGASTLKYWSNCYTTKRYPMNFTDTRGLVLVQGSMLYQGGCKGSQDMIEQTSRRPIRGQHKGILDIVIQLVKGLSSTGHVCDPSAHRLKSEQLGIREWRANVTARKRDI